jgi:hypothetical protein
MILAARRQAGRGPRRPEDHRRGDHRHVGVRGARARAQSKVQGLIRHVADTVSGGLPAVALRLDPRAARRAGRSQRNLRQRTRH